MGIISEWTRGGYCTYGCTYCFSNNRKGGFENNITYGQNDTEPMKKAFIKAFEHERIYKDVIIESLKHKVPLHVGGMADPFCYEEMVAKHTLDMIKFCNKYEYPMMFSTKTHRLTDEHWDNLNPKIHAFQLSMLGFDDDFVRQYETRTPLMSKRIEFLKELKRRGFWVSIRLQPILDMEQTKKIIEATKDYADFYTAEHLKVPMDSKQLRSVFADVMERGNYRKGKYSRHYELPTEEKINNVEKIKGWAYPVKVGAADNDIQFMSSEGVRNCCGADQAGEAFGNFIKYNTGYFVTGEYDKDDLWTPDFNIRKACNGDSVIDGLYHLKEYVSAFEERYYGVELPKCSSSKSNTLSWLDEVREELRREKENKNK